MSTTKLTSGICITPATDDNGVSCYEWLFDINGESFGGYCLTEAEARADAERILELAVDPLTPEQIDSCYMRLVGHLPISEGGMSEANARQLLFDRMKEDA